VLLSRSCEKDVDIRYTSCKSKGKYYILENAAARFSCLTVYYNSQENASIRANIVDFYGGFCYTGKRKVG
jgi:hypothetical protein